jgi:hypothetical protein
VSLLLLLRAAGTGYTATPADTVTVSDSLGRTRTVSRTLADTLALADQVTPVETAPLPGFPRQITLVL